MFIRLTKGVSSPICQNLWHLPYHLCEEVDRQVNDMLSQGITQPSKSQGSSSIVLVKKKGGSCCFSTDYCKLDSITNKDANPFPRVDDLLNALNDYNMYSTLDLCSGYWQVSLWPEDCEKTAFVAPSSLYEYLRISYINDLS